MLNAYARQGMAKQDTSLCRPSRLGFVLTGNLEISIPLFPSCTNNWVPCLSRLRATHHIPDSRISPEHLTVGPRMTPHLQSVIDLSMCSPSPDVRVSYPTAYLLVPWLAEHHTSSPYNPHGPWYCVLPVAAGQTKAQVCRSAPNVPRLYRSQPNLRCRALSRLPPVMQESSLDTDWDLSGTQGFTQPVFA